MWVGGELQTDEAELLLTPGTDDVLAARLIVLYQEPAEFCRSQSCHGFLKVLLLIGCENCQFADLLCWTQELVLTLQSEDGTGGANQTSNMGKIYQVIVNGLKGEKISIDLGHSEEEMNNLIVLELKKKIAAKLPGNSGDDVTRIRLVFTDKMLDDSNTLSSYGIQDKSVIQMVIQLPGGGHSVQMDL
ncbi:Ubiquitin-like protein-like [Scleropages formosus]|uniref:Ubiquitin-like protein-like n=1 Tax=Scleropages formosus TaxID=113540 RepID=A0A0P7UGP5_SCLFO|nr:Ubiquitin-like protein-like [Scleropages formosus]